MDDFSRKKMSCTGAFEKRESERALYFKFVVDLLLHWDAKFNTFVQKMILNVYIIEYLSTLFGTA